MVARSMDEYHQKMSSTDHPFPRWRTKEQKSDPFNACGCGSCTVRNALNPTSIENLKEQCHWKCLSNALLLQTETGLKEKSEDGFHLRRLLSGQTGTMLCLSLYGWTFVTAVQKNTGDFASKSNKTPGNLKYSKNARIAFIVALLSGFLSALHDPPQEASKPPR